MRTNNHPAVSWCIFLYCLFFRLDHRSYRQNRIIAESGSAMTGGLSTSPPRALQLSASVPITVLARLWMWTRKQHNHHWHVGTSSVREDWMLSHWGLQWRRNWFSATTSHGQQPEPSFKKCVRRHVSNLSSTDLMPCSYCWGGNHNEPLTFTIYSGGKPGDARDLGVQAVCHCDEHDAVPQLSTYLISRDIMKIVHTSDVNSHR